MKVTTTGEPWRVLLIESRQSRLALLQSVRRIAVIGIKTAESGGPAYDVPASLQRAGYDIVPVPVYYPDTTEILGEPVHRSLATVDPPAELVILFRRPDDVPKHLDELLAAHPRAVWMQLGIRHDAVAEMLARHGIAVVQDQCARTDLAHIARG